MRNLRLRRKTPEEQYKRKRFLCRRMEQEPS